jgi:hypothetical protein
MTGLMFVVAIGVALAAVIAKKVRTGPDFVEDRAPRIVSSYAAIDDLLPRQCGCGGRFHKEGEDTVRKGGVDCVRVLVVCVRCERKRSLLFQLAS